MSWKMHFVSQSDRQQTDVIAQVTDHLDEQVRKAVGTPLHPVAADQRNRWNRGCKAVTTVENGEITYLEVFPDQRNRWPRPLREEIAAAGGVLRAA